MVISYDHWLVGWSVCEMRRKRRCQQLTIFVQQAIAQNSLVDKLLNRETKTDLLMQLCIILNYKTEIYGTAHNPNDDK